MKLTRENPWIFIEKTNITSVPEIEHCVKLKHLSITNSLISTIPKCYPSLLESINLSNIHFVLL